MKNLTNYIKENTKTSGLKRIIMPNSAFNVT